MSKASEWRRQQTAPPSHSWRIGDDAITATVTSYGLQIYVGRADAVEQVNLTWEAIPEVVGWLCETFGEAA